jgi:hypothetical protein
MIDGCTPPADKIDSDGVAVLSWEKACRNPADFERAIKILLMKLHPEAEAIDGTGGDGGRDIQLRADGRSKSTRSRHLPVGSLALTNARSSGR